MSKRKARSKRSAMTAQVQREIAAELVTYGKVRETLEWSWNVGIAEDLHEDTIRHNAQWIASGIANGEEQEESDLVQDFLDRRCYDGLVIDAEWVPDDPFVAAALRKLLFTTPKEGEHNEGNHQ